MVDNKQEVTKTNACIYLITIYIQDLLPEICHCLLYKKE